MNAARLIQAGAGAAAMLMVCAPLAGAAGSMACKPPEIGSKRFPVVSPPLGKVVIGRGRLQFYAAPDLACAMHGVFVVPRDALVAYAESADGWASVTFMRSGLQGWVRSSRLKTTGTLGPPQ